MGQLLTRNASRQNVPQSNVCSRRERFVFDALPVHIADDACFAESGHLSQSMNFLSDNTATVAPEVLAALAAANDGQARAYGEDVWSRRLDAAFSKVFDCDVRVFTVATGTAANAVAIASVLEPWNSVCCHRESHIHRSECGAVECYSGGARLVLLDGAFAKISPDALEQEIARHARGMHAVTLRALSLSQTTERGVVYRPAEIAALSTIAHREGMAVHLDGARIANAVAALGCTPADLTWRAGVDLLSFGATKNGALAAEAIVLFDHTRAERIARLRKRGGHLISKGRYAAVQLLTLIEDGLWLRLATRANALAARLGAAAAHLLSAPVESNQIFIKPGAQALAALRAAGVEFHDWGGPHSGEARLIVSWNQPEAEVERLAALLPRIAAGGLER